MCDQNPVRIWRKNQKLTQAQAARLLHVGVNTLWNWEHDVTVPGWEHKRVIMEVTGCTNSEYRNWVEWMREAQQ